MIFVSQDDTSETQFFNYCSALCGHLVVEVQLVLEVIKISEPAQVDVILPLKLLLKLLILIHEGRPGVTTTAAYGYARHPGQGQMMQCANEKRD